MALGLFTNVNAQIVNIPDANLKMKLLMSNQYNNIAIDWTLQPKKIDQNNNNEIELIEIFDVIHLNIDNANISDLTGVGSFQNLQRLNCSNNSIQTLNIGPALSSFHILDCSNNQISNLNLATFSNAYNLNCSGNLITNMNESALTNLTVLNCGNNPIATLNLSYLINLQSFDCSYLPQLNLNLNSLTNLITLYCTGNQLTSVTSFNGLNNLTYLDISNNNLSSINLLLFPDLVYFYCSNNLLTSLNVSNLSNLEGLYCNNNQLTTLNFGVLDHLGYFTCHSNLLTSLDVSPIASIFIFDCHDNQLASLDISNTHVDHLNFNNNPLTTAFFKNGPNFSGNFDPFPNTPNLQYVCIDEDEIADFQNLVALYGYTNCHVNSYCSFTSGGAFYTIQGVNKFDGNNNGCDAADTAIPNLKFNISNGTNTGSLVSNFYGNYSIPVQAGTHTLTPVLENPSYFTVSPLTINVTFPDQASPLIQNFCVSANGIHPDLEIFISPIDRARPGFDARYSIVIKNKGNQVESGSLTFNFDDTKLDFVSSDVTAIQSTGTLTWNYSNLKPFKAKAYEVTLNVNSPMETPAVNGGDILTYNANITSGNVDEMPSDNTFQLNQTVVNSFDPNDITCLEGASVSTAKIGDYVHYFIRFENTGSTDATNIVVKDLVDVNKFDINTIVPYDANYDYYTRINGNNVEFVFEEIYLPFDDAYNDVYLAFKIKIKSTLVAGDIFSKNASIYFDYNFPIVTNTATTIIAALSRQDFEFSNYFNVYPNPVNDVLNISTKENIEVSSINIYNTLGQLVLVIPNAQNAKTVDVSSLSSGNYFIKINSDKGTSNTKFIKN